MEREVSKMKVIYAVFLGRSLCFLPSSLPSPNTVHPLLYGCSKCLLHNSFWERIYPGTTQILILSMSTHGYNPVNYQRHYAILLAIGVNTDTRNSLINVSNDPHDYNQGPYH